jgi:hypothetical protein
MIGLDVAKYTGMWRAFVNTAMDCGFQEMHVQPRKYQRHKDRSMQLVGPLVSE